MGRNELSLGFGEAAADLHGRAVFCKVGAADGVQGLGPERATDLPQSTRGGCGFSHAVLPCCFGGSDSDVLLHGQALTKCQAFHVNSGNKARVWHSNMGVLF